MTLSPPTVKDWQARYDPQPSDFNTYIRDTFNFLSTPPVLRTVQTTAQSIPDSASVWTVVQLNSVLEDTYGGWTSGASNLYTAQVAGRYALTLTVFASPAVSSLARAGFLYSINGATAGPFECVRDYAGASPWAWNCYAEIDLAVGDYFQPMFLNEGTAAINTSVGATGAQSSFEAVWISE